MGFSLEDSLGSIKGAVKKLKEKNLDFIFMNSKENISSENGRYVLIDKNRRIKYLPAMSKSLAAKNMFKFILLTTCGTTPP